MGGFWKFLLISLYYITINSCLSSELQDPTDRIYCRDSWIHNMSFPEFKTYTCAKCFVQVFFGEKPLIFAFIHPYLFVNGTNEDVFPDPGEQSEVCQTYLTGNECYKWRSCCEAAQICCKKVTSTTTKHDNQVVSRVDSQVTGKPASNIQVCPATWDGVSCWSIGLPDQTLQQTCPHYFEAPEVKWLQPKVSRKCDENGTWYVHPRHRIEMSDYLDCFDQSTNVKILQISIYIDITGKSLSIILLLTAVILILSIRALRRELAQSSNLKIHFNLFIAILFFNIFTIVMDVIHLDRIVISNTDTKSIESGHQRNTDAIYKNNAIWCRMIYTLSKYFMSASFMCMFCEGCHLHKRITHVMDIGMVDPLWKYYLISWGIPFMSVTVYVICRVVINNESCWIDETLSYLEFIHIVPNLISIACNFVFLVHIQWTLCTSLRTDTMDRKFSVIRQSLRATLSLIPIFGLQCLFIIYRPPWPPYEIIAAIIISSQGFLITILYFFNVQDVKTEIKKTFTKCCQSNDLSRQPSIISTATRSSRFSAKYSSSLEAIYNNRTKGRSNIARRQSAPDVMSVSKMIKHGHMKSRPYIFSNELQNKTDMSKANCKHLSNGGLALIDFHPKAAYKIKHSSWNGLPSTYDVQTSAEYNEAELEQGHPRSYSCTQGDENDHLMMEFRTKEGEFAGDDKLESTPKLLGRNLPTIPERRSSSGSRLSSDKTQ